MNNFSQELQRRKGEAESKEKILLSQISKLAGILGHKLEDLKDNRRDWYDEDSTAFNNVPDLLKDFEQDVQKIEHAAFFIDSTAFELSKHEMTLENIFDL